MVCAFVFVRSGARVCVFPVACAGTQLSACRAWAPTVWSCTLGTATCWRSFCRPCTTAGCVALASGTTPTLHMCERTPASPFHIRAPRSCVSHPHSHPRPLPRPPPPPPLSVGLVWGLRGRPGCVSPGRAVRRAGRYQGSGTLQDAAVCYYSEGATRTPAPLPPSRGLARMKVAHPRVSVCGVDPHCLCVRGPLPRDASFCRGR